MKLGENQLSVSVTGAIGMRDRRLRSGDEAQVTDNRLAVEYVGPDRYAVKLFDPLSQGFFQLGSLSRNAARAARRPEKTVSAIDSPLKLLSEQTPTAVRPAA